MFSQESIFFCCLEEQVSLASKVQVVKFEVCKGSLKVAQGYAEVTPFCWTGLVNIVNCMHVHRHVVHIYLSILDRTHIKTQFNTIIIIVPDVFCQSF